MGAEDESDRRPSADQTGAHRQIDDLDRAILAVLAGDGRAAVTDIAERVHASRSTVHARLRQLVDDEVITGFTATVDPGALGLGVAAVVLIDIEQSDWRRLHDELLAVDGVEYVAMCAGRFDLLVIARAGSIATMRDILLDQLQRIDGVRSTETVFLLHEDRATPPLDGADPLGR